MPITKRVIDIDEKIRDSMLDVRGPSPERLQRAGEQYLVGGEDRGVKIIRFVDDPLERVYTRLAKSGGTKWANRLEAEYNALARYRTAFVESNMIGTIGSVDPNRTYSPSPAGRDHAAKTDRQVDLRNEYWQARYHVNNGKGNRWGHKSGIVVDNVCCHRQSLVVAGYAIGGGKTASSAQERAERILRDAGYRLAVLWGMIR